MNRRTSNCVCLACLVVLAALGASLLPARAAEPVPLKLQKGDHVVILGNAFAERMQYFGHFETLLHGRFPTLELVVRDLGWSADEVTLFPRVSSSGLADRSTDDGTAKEAPLRLRSKDFQDHGHNLADHKADVILACFGMNESFAGPAGVPKFESDLDAFVASLLARKYNGRTPPRVALISPIAHEDLGNPHISDGQAHNVDLAAYTEAMRRVAAKRGVAFADLFAPSQKQMQGAQRKLTINGVHLNQHGDALVAAVLDEALFGPRPAGSSTIDMTRLRAEVNEKNLQFFFDYRAVNGFYIYGGRKNPFGTVNFPAEFAKLRAMTANRDRRIWAVAQGQNVPDAIDDADTGDFTKIETNWKNPVVITSPEESRKKMELPPGYEANLFASEIEFPELENPVQCAFDARGRLFVTTMPSYPMYLPGTPVDDKVLILEDTDGDGRADKRTVFAGGLHVPTGIELGDGGVYIAQQPNLVFLRDTDGDDRADERQIMLHGFDSADSHHAISAFTWDPGGALYFEEGTFHHSQVETPHGPRRCANAGVFRWEPRTWKFDVFVSYGFANPWGHTIDRWGQNFVADASPGANYFGAAFSGDVDYPNKHGGLPQFLVKQWRPTAGCELVSSRNFPDEAQGNYLLNNCIGFQGVLQYKMRDEGSGFAADPVDPLLRSSDPNFRPVDLEFGPDGALYVVDWFNPLVGHMQHSLRDPNRDKHHGRIWRIRYTGRPLVEPAVIAGQPVHALLDLLKTYEDRTRYRVRSELRTRNEAEVMAALKPWVAGLDTSDPDREHHLTEALWLHQSLDMVNADLLGTVLRSPDFRARAAATRVLCYWRDRVPEPLALLAQQARDEHPRVRLEAVRALSFFHDARAIEPAVESLRYETDEYLTYTLNETLKTLERRVQGGTRLAHEPTSTEQYFKSAPDAASALPPTRSVVARALIGLIEGGELPSQRVAAVVTLLCQFGDGQDLSYVLDKPLQSPDFSNQARVEVLTALADAATTRKIRPSGNVPGLERLLSSELAANDAKLRQAALRLASIWKVASVAEGFRKVVTNPASDDVELRAAFDGLVALGDKPSRELIFELTSGREAPNMRIRLQAAAALARLDPNNALGRSATALSEATGRDDPSPVLEAYLNRKGGAEKLAAGLSKRTLAPDLAKLALRYMYSVGRSDKALSDVLSKAAGIAGDPKPPTPEQVRQLVADVAAKGSAARGEKVFRRADLSCLKCHAVSQAGGAVGPDLSAVGSVSPVDYVVNSILDPNLAIKEQYVTKIIVTNSGEVHTGIVVEKDDVRLVLKDATGKLVNIPTADIDEEAEGKSLMPQGLTKFLTRDELIDLVRFISELGKPGDYAIRKTPTVQRWRVLGKLPAELVRQVPDDEAFRRLVLSARPEAWTPAYAQVAGALPLDELKPATEPAVVVLQGEVEVVTPGQISLIIVSTEPMHAWLDDHRLADAPASEITFTDELPKGRHRLTLRIEIGERAAPQVRAEFAKPADSPAQFQVVGGS